jgi:hypothetical protein
VSRELRRGGRTSSLIGSSPRKGIIIPERRIGERELCRRKTGERNKGTWERKGRRK